MSAYLVLVLLLLPGSRPADPPLQSELVRVVIAASGPAACQRYADTLAEQQRQLHAEALRRTSGRVLSSCTPLKPAEPAASTTEATS